MAAITDHKLPVAFIAPRGHSRVERMKAWLQPDSSLWKFSPSQHGDVYIPDCGQSLFLGGSGVRPITRFSPVSAPKRTAANPPDDGNRKRRRCISPTASTDTIATIGNSPRPLVTSGNLPSLTDGALYNQRTEAEEGRLAGSRGSPRPVHHLRPSVNHGAELPPPSCSPSESTDQALPPASSAVGYPRLKATLLSAGHPQTKDLLATATLGYPGQQAPSSRTSVGYPRAKGSSSVATLGYPGRPGNLYPTAGGPRIRTRPTLPATGKLRRKAPTSSPTPSVIQGTGIPAPPVAGNPRQGVNLSPPQPGDTTTATSPRRPWLPSHQSRRPPPLSLAPWNPQPIEGLTPVVPRPPRRPHYPGDPPSDPRLPAPPRTAPKPSKLHWESTLPTTLQEGLLHRPLLSPIKDPVPAGIPLQL